MQLKWNKLTVLIAMSFLLQAAAIAGGGNKIVPSIKLSVVINKQSQRGEIRWYTMPGKTNMLRFEVQKSVDGNNFSYVTSIAGDQSTGLAKYYAEDRNLLAGTSYYRLRIIYKDGSEGYSSTTAMAAGTQGVAVLPTVAEEQLYIWLPGNSRVSTVTVSDVSGKKVLHQAAVSISAGLASIDVKGIAPGFYNLDLQLSPTNNVHLKFSKK